MKVLNTLANDYPQAKYLQLVQAIRAAIQQGQMAAGDKLPSVAAMSQDSGLNRHTVMKSLAELVAQGWIESVQRVGYRVAHQLPFYEQSQLLTDQQDIVEPMDYRLVRTGSPLPSRSANNYQYNFSGGQPDVARFPFGEFKRCMSEVLARPNFHQLSYGQSAGAPELIEQVKQYLRKTRAITQRDIVITNGSQEALFIVAQLLIKVGDKVAVEALGYPPAMSAFANTGATLVGVKQDEQGMCPDDLALQISKGNIRLIYLTPLHQYPTTVTLPLSRRTLIYQLALKHKIPIVEDDYDHEFHYRCQPLAPMASQDPALLIIYLSSFSKIMFPSARIGIMAVSPALAKAVTQYRLLICHKGNVLMQQALAKWMANGGFERHLRRTTRLNLQRRDHAIAVLQKYRYFEFTIPDGGMALWVRLKNNSASLNQDCSAQMLAQRCQEKGVYLQHEKQFHLTPQVEQDSYIRLGFAGLREQDFAQGIALLVAELHDNCASQ